MQRGWQRGGHHDRQRRGRLTRSTWGWLFAAALAFGGCDDGTSTPETGPDMNVGGMGGGAGGMGGGAGGMGGGAGGAIVDGRELQVVGEINQLVRVSETLSVEIRLVGGADLSPVPNANIEATLFDRDGNEAAAVDGTSLRGRRVTTNDQGVAAFELVAGDVATTLRLEASSGDATPVSVNITVANEGEGSLAVRVTYDAEQNRYSFNDFREARVDLFLAGETNCDLLESQAANLVGAWLSLPSITPFNEVDNSVNAEALAEGLQFNVVATSVSATGGVLAFGCTPDVSVVGGQVTDVEVAVDDLALEFKGRFDAVSEFDLTRLLEASENPTLNTLAEVMGIIRVLGNGNGDRGAELTRLFCDVVDFDDGVCRILETVGGPLVNRVFEMVIPQMALDTLTLLSDLVGIVSELTVVGQIEFIESFPDADGNLTGSDNRWQKFRLTWRGETRDFTFGNLGRDYRPVAGAFDATVEGTTINIGAHTLTLKLGVIALGVLEQWIAPALTGFEAPVTLTDLLLAVVPCADVDEFLFDDPADGFCPDVLMPALAGLIADQIGRLDLDPDNFVVTGRATVADTDGDLLIDTLSDGVWSAQLSVGGGTLDIPGCFTACRDMPCPEVDCEIPRVDED